MSGERQPWHMRHALGLASQLPDGAHDATHVLNCLWELHAQVHNTGRDSPSYPCFPHVQRGSALCRALSLGQPVTDLDEVRRAVTRDSRDSS